MIRHFIFILFVAIILITGLPVTPVRAYDPVEPGDFVESMDSFTVQMSQGNEAGISIEHYRAKNGKTPVCLYAGDLEITLRMDEKGHVRGFFTPTSPPVFIIDLAANEIQVGNRRFPFSIPAQNPVRTRLRFPHQQNSAAFITFKINRVLGQAEVLMGGTTLLRLNVAFNEMTPGRYELIFKDPFVVTYTDFILESAAGMIYNTGGGQ
jgi:hypothetical protein